MKESVYIISNNTLLVEGVKSLANPNRWQIIRYDELSYSIENDVPTIIDGDLLVQEGGTGSQLPSRSLVIVNKANFPMLRFLIEQNQLSAVVQSESKERLDVAISEVADGKRFLSDKYKMYVFNQKLGASHQNWRDQLSDREIQVCELIAKGMKSQSIADSLNLSIHTIHTHRKRILKKLELSSPTELIQLLLKS